MQYFAKGSENGILSKDDLKEGIFSTLEKLGIKKKVLVIPPDITRFYSYSGILTRFVYQYYSNALTDILPSIGTHFPMTSKEIERMYDGVPAQLFRVHNWRKDLATLGEVPPEFINQVSEGKLNYSWPAQVNKLIVEGKYDLILSIGQVVPHEVVGMANYNKNMERMMGRADTPVRRVLNYASDHFANHLPILYVLTVIGKNNKGKIVPKGLYIGDDFENFRQASELSLKVNFQMLNKPLKKVVVYLEPEEFKSTWLGNKSIYRTRMAIDDGGELFILAPGLKEFGEDKTIDQLIRKYGYRTTPEILEFVNENKELQNNLSAAAHLIHGSSEDRFTITYCPGYVTKDEIESVNYQYADLKNMIKKYDPQKLTDGFNITDDGEEIFYISNPALGLWAYKENFK